MAGQTDDAILLLELMDSVVGTSEVPAVAAPPISGIVVGRLVSFSTSEGAQVILTGRESEPPIRARWLTGLTSKDKGRSVAIMFESGNIDRALIVGCVEPLTPAGAAPNKEPLEIDAESIVFKADREVVLRCGEASVVLKQDGRVVVRGAYVETRSKGVNRIKGGSVQIN